MLLADDPGGPVVMLNLLRLYFDPRTSALLEERQTPQHGQPAAATVINRASIVDRLPTTIPPC